MIYGFSPLSPVYVLRSDLVIAQKAPRRSGSVLFAKEKEVIPENETAEEQRERLRKKARKSMFNENGVAYAPWMARQIDEEVSFCGTCTEGTRVYFNMLVTEYCYSLDETPDQTIQL